MLEGTVSLICFKFGIEAIQALLAAHPYEEPAWDVVALVTGLAD